jgi:3-hydroxybutyryl-CoA dehydrogenase
VSIGSGEPAGPDQPGTVAVAGAGLMGSQIGCEYAPGGHPVVWLVRDRGRAERRIASALALAVSAGLADAAAAADAEDRMTFVADPAEHDSPVWLAVESIVEDLDSKAKLLRRIAAVWPAAAIASNSSSIATADLGRAAQSEHRLIGTHYWNPPLLMPLVEIVLTGRTPDTLAAEVEAALTRIGKRPVEVRRDVPGFAWNRLQFAMLRECLWLVENGVLRPETVDEIVREGLARRWRFAGPFETVALGGAATFDAIARNLFPQLSDAHAAGGFAQFLEHDPERLSRLRQARDDGLIAELHAERHRPEPDG